MQNYLLFDSIMIELLDHAYMDLDLIIDGFNEGLLGEIEGEGGGGEGKWGRVVVTFLRW